MPGKVLSLNSGPTVLLNRLCEEIDFEETLNRLLPWDPARSKLSPGTRIKALVMNILTGRDPLYKVETFYRDQDVELLFGPGVRADDLTDDGLARALDKPYEASPWTVYSTLALHAVHKLHPGGLGPLHNDTTSLCLEGAYERDGTPAITYGYSKDHLPDLKRIVLGLGVTQGRIPILATVEDGNTSDKTWNHTFIHKLRRALSQEDWETIVYVADSALVTTRNLKYMARLKLPFVSRLPDLFAVGEQVKQEAWQAGQWQDIGILRQDKGAAAYQVQSFARTIKGRPYRLVVVYSSQLDARKAQSLERQIRQEEQSLQQAWTALTETAFHCEADARQAIATFGHGHPSVWFAWEADVQPMTRAVKRAHRGRPRKDEPVPMQTVYVPVLTKRERCEAAVEARKGLLSTFVLISNVAADRYTDGELLRTYKVQEVAETRFRLRKDPQMVDGLFLKTSERIAALGIVLVMALLLYGILEERIRRQMDQESTPLRFAGRSRDYRPTGQVLLETLAQIKVLLMGREEGDERLLTDNADAVARRIVEMAGYDMTMYTARPVRAVGC
jgi:transposase